MESTIGARSDQSMPPALRLWIESDGEGRFNPDTDAVDFSTLQVLSVLSMEIRGNSESAFQIMICAEVSIAELIEDGPGAFAQGKV
jgi:hypothetical protein